MKRAAEALLAFVCIAVVGTFIVLAFATRSAYFVYTDDRSKKEMKRELLTALLIGGILMALVALPTRCEAQEPPLHQVVGIQNPWTDGKGGGVIVGSNVVITVAHVVRNADYVMVYVYDSDRPHKATIQKISYELDLACLSLELPKEAEAATFGREPKVTDSVWFIGHPSTYSWLTLHGRVAHQGVHMVGPVGQSVRKMTIDMSAFGGSSGGGIFNERWQLVGIGQSMSTDFPLFHSATTKQIKGFCR